MPKLILSAEFNEKFTDLERNHAAIQDFLIRGVVDYHVDGLRLPANYRLVKSRNVSRMNGDDVIKIRLIAEHTETHEYEIAYAVNLVIRDDILEFNQHCTQVLVWRSDRRRHRTALIDFATLMFEHFTSEYIVIASDTEQTNDGRRFWQARIIDALEDDKFVYFINHNDLTEGMIPVLNHIASEREFLDVWFDHGWGVDEEYKDRIFLISSDLLM